MRNGRPRLDATDRTVSVRFRVPAREYARLTREAKTQRVTLSEYLRTQSKPRIPNRTG
jgi:hypothetical protein